MYFNICTRRETDELHPAVLDGFARMTLNNGAAMCSREFQAFRRAKQPITGTVRDRETGEPIAGISVLSVGSAILTTMPARPPTRMAGTRESHRLFGDRGPL